MKTKAGIKIVLLTAAMALAMNSAAFAAGWQNDGKGWRWQNDDGSNPSSTWQWIDGNYDHVAECYYFDENGYCLQNTTTPDGYEVNADGAWVADGAVQTQTQNVSDNAAGTDASADTASINGVYKLISYYTLDGQEYIFETIYEITEQADQSILLRCDDLVNVFPKVGDHVYELPCSDNAAGVDRIIIEGNTLRDICTTYGIENVFTKQ